MTRKELRVPPQNIDAERALLGAIMLRPEGIHEIEGTLVSDAFYVGKHKIIFEAMQTLALRHEPIDILSITHRLTEDKRLEQAGGASYLSELAQDVPASTNVRYYADIIDRKYVLRNLVSAGEYIAELGMDASVENVEEVIDQSEKKIFDISNSPKGKVVTSLKDNLDEAWTRIEHLHEHQGDIRGISTGYANLDSLLAGFQPSDLIILAARPSMGKTTLALDIARKAATKNNAPVLVFSLEMATQQLVDRMLAAEARVNAWSLRTGRLNADTEFSSLRDALDRLSKAPIYIDDQPSNTIARMRSLARRLKVEKGLKLIVVDYLQLMMPSKNYDSMVNQVTEISRSLKALARDLDVPVLALSQLSRAVESRGGKPRLSDLRDSGSIEQDADVVMFIHREDKYNENSDKPNIAEILIEKHRNGPVGKAELYFDEKTGTFLDVENSKGFEVLTKGGNADFGTF